jgi:hypothetical protein
VRPRVGRCQRSRILEKIIHDEVVEEGATILTLGMLEVFLMGIDLRPI